MLFVFFLNKLFFCYDLNGLRISLFYVFLSIFFYLFFSFYDCFLSWNHQLNKISIRNRPLICAIISILQILFLSQRMLNTVFETVRILFVYANLGAITYLSVSFWLYGVCVFLFMLFSVYILRNLKDKCFGFLENVRFPSFLLLLLFINYKFIRRTLE